MVRTQKTNSFSAKTYEFADRLTDSWNTSRASLCDLSKAKIQRSYSFLCGCVRPRFSWRNGLGSSSHRIRKTGIARIRSTM